MKAYVLQSAGSTPMMYPDGRPFTVGPSGILLESHDRGDGVHIADVPVEFVAELRDSHGLIHAQPIEAPTVEHEDKEPSEEAHEEAHDETDHEAETEREPHHRRPRGRPRLHPPKPPLFTSRPDPPGTPHPEEKSDKEWDSR